MSCNKMQQNLYNGDIVQMDKHESLRLQGGYNLLHGQNGQLAVGAKIYKLSKTIGVFAGKPHAAIVMGSQSAPSAQTAFKRRTAVQSDGN